ncbi:hypothetical protein P5667_11835 [Bacillus velezensis]|uniref:hypothetical protein n=1 Tax=Bacillus velezensis TaxID=492670 RepID=UPI0027995E3C|nr:hypothetical protein [Bacillus velezensis]MEE4535015.1 hypothetical protein [Bacillus velezensis]WEY79814.1 hypothetical protein P5667_11835 [Bacillus velezensis]
MKKIEVEQMSETSANTNTKIHVLADEKLGGIKREYIEVEREGEVGDKVIHVYKGESNGIVRVVRKAADDGVDVDTFEDEGELYSGFYHGYYCVLVPLDKEKTFENKHNVYKELKNLIHNELGISRQDIQKMISNAVSNEVQKMSESGKLDRVAGEKI